MNERDDVHLESEDPEGDERAQNKIVRLRDELAVCRKEKQEYMDGWQRAKADYVNALRRFDEDLKTAKLRGTMSAVESLLPAFDALERAKEHGEIPEGFLAIARQLESAFAALGLHEVGRQGEEFNPARHEAFGQDAVESEQQDNVVTAILEKGWGVGDTILRPAKVRVGHFDRKKS